MENIEYSSRIVSKRTIAGDVIKRNHRKFLEIGNENLKDFNKRMNVQTQLEYIHYDNSFSISTISNNARIQHLSREFLMEINRYITLIRAQFDQNFIKNEYVQGVENDVNCLQQEIRAKHHIENKKGLTDGEKVEFLNWINELINLRENSYPISVLTNKGIIKQCKREVNALCADLSKEFTIGGEYMEKPIC
jgi:hypothetical protein